MHNLFQNGRKGLRPSREQGYAKAFDDIDPLEGGNPLPPQRFCKSLEEKQPLTGGADWGIKTNL